MEIVIEMEMLTIVTIIFIISFMFLAIGVVMGTDPTTRMNDLCPERWLFTGILGLIGTIISGYFMFTLI